MRSFAVAGFGGCTGLLKWSGGGIGRRYINAVSTGHGVTFARRFLCVI